MQIGVLIYYFQRPEKEPGSCRQSLNVQNLSTVVDGRQQIQGLPLIRTECLGITFYRGFDPCEPFQQYFGNLSAPLWQIRVFIGQSAEFVVLILQLRQDFFKAVQRGPVRDPAF